MTPTQFTELFQRYLDRTATPEEQRVLIRAWGDDDPALQTVKERLVDDAFDKLPVMFPLTPEQSEDMFQRVLERVQEPGNERSPAPVRRLRAWHYAAAVVIIVGAWLLLKPGEKNANGKQESSVVKVQEVAPPATSRATITLSNGQKVYLDSADNRILAREGNVLIKKLDDGQIVYQGAATGISYNMLVNPRGSKVINLTFSDGSKVWLNAGSSVRYPTEFAVDKRAVEITGEAYFEVTHDAAKSFMVIKGTTSVQVLGTHFNVNAYDDEVAIRVTLLEGSVRVGVNGGVKVAVIKPGEQAVVANKAGTIRVNKDADTEEVMAWKEGKFRFGEDADIKTIMRQIARWYDVDVQYQGEVNGKFWGSVSRNVNLTQVLNILQETGDVHFTVDGRTITVRP